MKKDGFSIRFLTIVVCNLEKRKKGKLRNSIFDGPLLVNLTFSQTEFIIGKSSFCSYYAFSLNQMYGNDRWFRSISQKFYRVLYFVVGTLKNFKLLTDIYFDSGFQNIASSSLQLFSRACY